MRVKKGVDKLKIRKNITLVLGAALVSPALRIDLFIRADVMMSICGFLIELLDVAARNGALRKLDALEIFKMTNQRPDNGSGASCVARSVTYFRSS